MNYCTRTAAFVVLFVSALAGLAQYRPAWAAQVDLDWWSLPELCEDLQHGEQESDVQEARRQAAVDRLGARVAVIDDLRARRLTLAQAAARFRRLNATPGGRPVDLSRHMAGATEEERLCRQVIAWAEGADG